uniref:Uncharacterized protein n=1 Tax=Mycena chlorophos TaxID=658473 RepID=A0ABQ0LTA8_MYCCL|nr:predicted protein [Mycena chlorophos]
MMTGESASVKLLAQAIQDLYHLKPLQDLDQIDEKVLQAVLDTHILGFPDTLGLPPTHKHTYFTQVCLITDKPKYDALKQEETRRRQDKEKLKAAEEQLALLRASKPATAQGSSASKFYGAASKKPTQSSALQPARKVFAGLSTASSSGQTGLTTAERLSGTDTFGFTDALILDLPFVKPSPLVILELKYLTIPGLLRGLCRQESEFNLHLSPDTRTRRGQILLKRREIQAMDLEKLKEQTYVYRDHDSGYWKWISISQHLENTRDQLRSYVNAASKADFKDPRITVEENSREPSPVVGFIIYVIGDRVLHERIMPEEQNTSFRYFTTPDWENKYQRNPNNYQQ